MSAETSHERGGGPDVAEALGLDRHQLVLAGHVGDEHPDAHDVGEGEARLHERAFDDVEDRAGLCGDVVRVAGTPVGTGVGRACDPARVADDDRSTVGRRPLPRPARGDPAPTRGRHPRWAATPRHSSDDGVRSDLEEQAGEHRRSRHDRIDLEVLRRGVVVAANRPEAVEGRDAHAGRRVRVGRAAGRAVVHDEPETLGDGLRVLRRAGPTGRSFPSAATRTRLPRRPSCPGLRSWPPARGSPRWPCRGPRR